LQVPTHLVDVSKSLGLRKWVKKRGFPKAEYFTTIDDTQRIMARHPNPDQDTRNNEAIVRVLAAMLDHEGILATHVLGLSSYASIGDTPEQRWAIACTAAGWVVLQAYDLACQTGGWTPA
jgi:hypothetical protein